MRPKTALQDCLQDNYCYGCGADNPAGMQIKSYWDGDETVCRYLPRAEQSAGPRKYVYGGTIASLIDCHCVGTAAANQYRIEGRDAGEGEMIWCVTGRLEVDYLTPVPIDQPIDLRARIEEVSGKKTVLSCSVMSGDTLCAKGRVIAIRVPNSWRD